MISELKESEFFPKNSSIQGDKLNLFEPFNIGDESIQQIFIVDNLNENTTLHDPGLQKVSTYLNNMKDLAHLSLHRHSAQNDNQIPKSYRI